MTLYCPCEIYFWYLPHWTSNESTNLGPFLQNKVIKKSNWYSSTAKKDQKYSYGSGYRKYIKYAYVGGVGGQKAQKFAYVIYEWYLVCWSRPRSLHQSMSQLETLHCFHLDSRQKVEKEEKKKLRGLFQSTHYYIFRSMFRPFSYLTQAFELFVWVFPKA